MWTNSVVGRIVCAVFGVGTVLMCFGAAVEGDTAVDAGFVVRAAVVMLVAVVVVVASWTSELRLADGFLTATNLGISRSMLLTDVVDVEPAVFPFLGMKIRRADRTGIRTLVSGRAWNESSATRAERIAREISELAEEARTSSTVAGEPSVAPGNRTWSTWQYLGACAFVFCLGLGALVFGVLAARDPLSADSVRALLGLIGGPALIALAGLGARASFGTSERSDSPTTDGS